MAGDPRQSSRAQGAKGSPAPLCPLESRGPGAKTACVAFMSRGALGMFAARGDFPFAECSCQKLVLGRRCDGASALNGPAGSGVMAAAWAQKAFAHKILLPRQGEPVGSGFRAPETPSKAAGPREPGQPRPALLSGEWRAGVENGLCCFPEMRRDGAFACCLRRHSLCTMQLPEARFGPSVRRGLGAVRPSWLRGHGCGLGVEGHRVPNPASPPRRTGGECVSGTGDTQQSSMALGARGSPAPLCPLESRGPGAKSACVVS